MLGSERRIGIWILPLFVLVAALAATLAGGLALLYYGQQVRQLDARTQAARDDAVAAAERVAVAASEASAAIDADAAAVRDALSLTVPVAQPNDHGVYALAADHAGGEVRVATGFTVYSDTTETYLVTSHELIATADGAGVGQVRVALPGGAPVVARVHAFDAALDLAVVVAPGGPLPVLPWRPVAEPPAPGQRLFLVGVAGQDAVAVVEGTLAGIGPQTLIPALPVSAAVAGGPLIDPSGRVLGIASRAYQPYGEVDGDLPYAVPVRALCRALIACSADDLGGLAPDAAQPGTAPVNAEQRVPPRTPDPVVVEQAPVEVAPPPPPPTESVVLPAEPSPTPSPSPPPLELTPPSAEPTPVAPEPSPTP